MLEWYEIGRVGARMMATEEAIVARRLSCFLIYSNLEAPNSIPAVRQIQAPPVGQKQV